MGLYRNRVPRHENRFCWRLSWGTSSHANTCTSWLTAQDAYIIYRVARAHAEHSTYERACYRSYIKKFQFATWRYMGKTMLLLMLQTPPHFALFSNSIPTLAHIFYIQTICDFLPLIVFYVHSFYLQICWRNGTVHCTKSPGFSLYIIKHSPYRKKKLWEELIAYFPSIRQGRPKISFLQQFFVSARTFYWVVT